MGYIIEDFIESSNACMTREEAFSLYRKAIKAFGFDSAVYTFVTDHPDAGQKAGHAVACNFPDDWMTHYIEQHYEEIDPVIMQVHRTAYAFSWDSLHTVKNFSKEQKTILHEAKESGLKDGIGIPLYGPRNELAGVGLAGSEKGMDLNRNTMSKLQLITSQFHLVYCALEQKDPETSNIPVLTKREREVLKWWAIGKTADEIAMILGCSKANVKFHVKRVYEKLEANSKILAVTKAIRWGLIPLDMLKIT